MNELKPVHTPCAGCRFAEGEGKTQTGCKAGRLEAFRAIDPAIVIEAENETGEFFLINGRQCNLKRVAPWGDGLDDEALLRKAREEARTRSALVLVLEDIDLQGDNAIGALTLTLWCALNASPMPFHEVIVVDNQGVIPAKEILALVEASAAKSNAVWRHVTVTARNEDGSRLAFGKATDCGLAHLKGSDYYTAARAGQFLPLTLPADLDRARNEDLKLFVALDHGDGTGPTVLVAAHRAGNIGGNEMVAYALDDPQDEAEGGADEVILESPLDKCRHLAPRLVLPLSDVVQKCPC